MAVHTYALTIAYNAGGQFATNTLHYNFDDSGYATTIEAANALLAAWDLTIRSEWIDMLPTAVTLLTGRCRRVGTTGGFEAVAFFPGGTTGTRTGAMMAAGTGPVLIFYPVANGRQRGRIFLPGISISDAIDGVITNAFKTAMFATIGNVSVDLTLVGGGAPTASLVIWKQKPPQTATSVLQIRLSDLIATQRRRQVPV